MSARWGFRPRSRATTLYDEPVNRLSWYIRDWESTQALQWAYLPAWSALVRVADVESCPAPWTVMEHMMSGDVNAVGSYVSGFDPDTLNFCAALPLMIHGYPFESESVREQFASVSLARYINASESRGSIYRVNPEFDADMLSDVEAIYRRTLRDYAP